MFPVMLLMLVLVLTASIPPGHCTMIGIEPAGTDIEFDLTQVPANVPGPVVVRACVKQGCVSHLGSSIPRGIFSLNNAGLTDPEPVDVRVVARDHGRVVFDDAIRLVHLRERHPNGPGCDPALFDAGVQATPEGELIQQ